MSISDMAENPVKANIQGYEIHLVKINKIGGQPTVPVLAGYKREEDPPHRLTPRRVALTSEK